MSGPAQLYEHSSQRKAKYFFFSYLLIHWWRVLWSLASKIHNAKNPDTFKY